MPYSTKEALPPSVRDSLPEKAQEIFLGAFNSAFSGTCKDREDKEACCNAIAWAAVKKGYHKEGDQWLANKCTECTGPHCFFAHATITPQTHEIILTGLNSWMDFPERKERYYYAVKNFEGTEHAWNEVPVIYAQDHPEHDLVKDDLEAALNSVKTYEGEPGRICGTLFNSEVVTSGQPRLTANIRFNDPDLEKRYLKGELAPSDAFYCNKNEDGTLAGKVRPNHLLIFVQDENNQRRDKVAMLLHKGAGTVIETTFEHAGRVISASNAKELEGLIGEHESVMGKLRSFFKKMTGVAGGGDEAAQKAEPPMTVPAANKPMEDKMTEELKKELESVKAALANKDAEIAAKDKEIAEIKAAHTELSKKLVEFDQKAADAEWKSTFENRVPKGWKAEKTEDVLRKEYEDNKVAFMNKLLDAKVTPPQKGEEGEQFANKDPAADALALSKELRAATGRR